ncbi:MAG: HAD family hydrolase, partial [Chloroflexi bacterium]|nr:HAD family hydrolase [Chloroflexota bacterium]
PDLVASLGPEGLVPFSQSLATIQRSQSRVQFELVNGAIETLEALAEHYRLGVVSDGQGAFVRAELRELGISRYFDVVVVAGDLGYRKPDPRLFRRAIEQMGTASTSSVYVGTDPERDARASDAIGMRPVLVGHRSVPEELVGVPVRPVRELSHVPDAVASVVARLRTQATQKSVAKPASPQDVVERTSHA